MSEKILKLPDVIEVTGLSRSTIYAYIKEGVFPKPILLGPRGVGWIYSEIGNWVQERIKKSRASNTNCDVGQNDQ